MSYFNEIKNKLAQTGQTAIQKTKTFSEESKINQEINELLDQNEELFARIGRIIFEKYAVANQDKEIGELIETLNANNNRLAEKYQKRRKLKGLELCLNCGMEVSADASFCPGCGSKIEKVPIEPVEEDPDQRTCPNCGNPLADNAKFCPKCGERVE